MSSSRFLRSGAVLAAGLRAAAALRSAGTPVSRRAPVRVLAWALACAAAVLPPCFARASPLQMFGFGGRSPALGATGVATSDGFDSVYLNPAGLVEARRKRLSFGGLVGGFDLRGPERAVEAATGTQIGAVLPIPFGGALRDRVVLGIGFYVPTNVLARARAPMTGEPYYALLESRAHVVGVQVAAGVRLSVRTTVGAGFLALAALRGRIDVSTDAAGRFTSVSEQQLVSHFAPILGGRHRIADDLTVGATLRFKSKSEYDILVTNELADVLPIALPELRFAGVAQYDPLTVAAEAAWRPRSAWIVAAQLAWEHWSAFPPPTENPVVGGRERPGPGFHDTVIPRLGVEWRARRGSADVAARGGYFFAMTPAPEMTGEQALLDNHRHVVSVGGGLAFPRSAVPLHLDAWFQLHVLQPRTHRRPEGPLETSGRIYVGGIVVGVDL